MERRSDGLAAEQSASGDQARDPAASHERRHAVSGLPRAARPTAARPPGPPPVRGAPRGARNGLATGRDRGRGVAAAGGSPRGLHAAGGLPGLATECRAPPLKDRRRVAPAMTICYVQAQPKAKRARRVVRGGSYWNNARNCRSAYRNANEPGNRNRNQGFRLAAAHPLRKEAADPAFGARPIVVARTVPSRVLVGGWMPVRTLSRRLFISCPSA
ncbi:MAG: SUMF1/EgtB/PvdO family nonheme iron enzyme [Verrucomicrobiales bacterium]|nr:SUMF1/EgtB/PvdO family nonheme iron enzyme [Verrucomicrobiales bacterium]